jgi:hypothetical protein
MSNLFYADYSGPVAVGSYTPRGRSVGGKSASSLVRQGRHPYVTEANLLLRENKEVINKRKAAAERAQKEYTNSLKKLIANFTEQKRKQIANKIAAGKQVNELKRMTSENGKAGKAREKATALRKLKNNLKANKNRISNNLHANYNAWARVWITKLFDLEFNKGYLPLGEREELKEAINKVKKGLADVIKHDKELKNLKKAAESAEWTAGWAANNAAEARRKAAEANAKVRRKAAEAALKRASPSIRLQENRRQINRMIAAARAANQASRTFRRQTHLFGPSNMRGRPKRA